MHKIAAFCQSLPYEKIYPQFHTLRAVRLVFGNHFYRLPRVPQTGFPPSRRHFHMDVPDLRTRCLPCSCQSYDTQLQLHISRSGLCGYYLYRRIYYRQMAEQTGTVPLGLFPLQMESF